MLVHTESRNVIEFHFHFMIRGFSDEVTGEILAPGLLTRHLWQSGETERCFT
ncbi:MAG TPA: hypothetical protein VMX74_04365 [Pirellulales bacterium]|nr:hypothetical protein [Pirellulales bacterium]